MKRSFAILAVIIAGAYGYPLWQTNTVSPCQALEMRSGGVGASSARTPGFLAGAKGSAEVVLRAIPGSGTLDQAANSVGCTVGYWRVVLEPRLYRLMASAR